jgi:hypothetical protein
MIKLIETSTSTGTGNFTLGGAYNVANSSMSGNLKLSDRIPLKLYFPYMIQDDLGNWEYGKGYLSNATTLVRDYVLSSPLGDRAKVNFPAGDKKVFYPTEGRAFGPDYYSPNVWKNTTSNIGYRSAMTATAGYMYFVPHLQMTPQLIKAVGIKVTTAVASSRIKLAIYNFKRQADGSADYQSSFPLAFEIGEVSGATTGEKTIDTNFYLPEGAYMIGVCFTHANGVTGNSTQYNWNTMYWETLAGDQICYLAQSGVDIDNLPATTFGALTRSSNSPTPCVGIKGYCI